jgi:hypothetical protein
MIAVKIFTVLNSSLQEALDLAPIIILMSLFCNLKMAKVTNSSLIGEKVQGTECVHRVS